MEKLRTFITSNTAQRIIEEFPMLLPRVLSHLEVVALMRIWGFSNQRRQNMKLSKQASESLQNSQKVEGESKTSAAVLADYSARVVRMVNDAESPCGFSVVFARGELSTVGYHPQAVVAALENQLLQQGIRVSKKVQTYEHITHLVLHNGFQTTVIWRINEETKTYETLLYFSQGYQAKEE